MGHSRVGYLPRTQKWTELFGLLETESPSPSSLAAATLGAIQQNLQTAADNPRTAHAIWLLTQLPLAATKDEFTEALGALGLEFASSPSLSELSSTVLMSAVAPSTDTNSLYSDYSELAFVSVTEAISETLKPALPTLFGTSPEDVKIELARLHTKVNFGKLAHSFFARFVRKVLNYYLSRELPRHVGKNQAFSNIESYRTFNDALETHCYQAAKIVEEFSGAWYSKAQYEGTLTPFQTQKYFEYSIRKIVGELKRGAQR